MRLDNLSAVRGSNMLHSPIQSNTLPWFLLAIVALVSGVVIYFMRKRYAGAEDALLESEIRFREFAEAASDAFWEMDENLCFSFITSASGEVEELTPLVSTPTVLGKTRWEAAGVEDPLSDPVWERHYQDLKQQRPFRDFCYSYERADMGGQRVWTNVSGMPLFHKDGSFRGYRGTSTNITAEMEARAKVEESRIRFLNAIKSISEGFTLWDAENKLLLWNEPFQSIFAGLSEPIESGISFDSFVADAVSSEIVRLDEDYKLEGLFGTSDDTSADTQQAKLLEFSNNRYIMLSYRRTPNGEVVAIWTDVSELKHREEELVQAQKMEVVGQLTGGVAHDFNNLLSVIIGNLELLERHVTEPAALRSLSRAFRGAQRCTTLTQRLLAFSRRQRLQPQVSYAANLIEEMADLIQSSLGGAVTMRFDIDDDVWPLMVDVQQLETSFLNIALNAKDAMPHGGELRIQVRNARISEQKAVQVGAPAAGDYIEISFSDSGIGMSDEVKSRAFEPFYTTKDVGRGSGLGLSMVYGFVSQSCGFLQLESEAGKGTTVSLFLPRATDLVPLAEEEKTIPRIVNSGRGRVLVVEDDPDVRELTITMLTQLNYRVIEAEDGQSALRILKESKEEIDLLLTDIVLPGGVTGIDLAKEAELLIPDISVLLMSGYAPQKIDSMVAKENYILLRKPFLRNEMIARINDALTQPRKSHAQRKLQKIE